MPRQQLPRRSTLMSKGKPSNPKKAKTRSSSPDTLAKGSKKAGGALSEEQRGSRTGLEDVDGELVVMPAERDLEGGLPDRPGQAPGEPMGAQLMVGLGAGGF